LIWLANFILLLSIWLLGRKNFRSGWITNMLGSAIYAYVSVFMLHPRHFDIASFNLIVMCLGGWNLWKTLKAK